MPLITPRTERFEHPTEPGAWFDLRLPLTAGSLTGIRGQGASQAEVVQHMVTATLVAWSYDAPVDYEHVAMLDLDTYTWLAQLTQTRSGVLDESEKNASSSASRATSAPGTERSPANSGT